MKIALVALAFIMIFTGCPGTATAEIGMTDDQLLARAPLGDIYMRVLKIELPAEGDYQTIWDGPVNISVPISSGSVTSVTINQVSITPADYDRIRVTVDSVGFTDGANETLLDAGETQFIATAAALIPVDDGDEVTMIVNIATTNWFDADSIRIKPNTTPFQGAILKRGL